MDSTAFNAPVIPSNGVRVNVQNKTCVQKRSHVMCSASSTSVTRRAALIGLAMGAVSTVLPEAAFAGDVEPYVDLPKGFRVMRPTSWNEFSAAPEQYDIKWQDVINPLEFVTVLTTPASKPLSNLGSASEVGARLAKARGGDLVAADDKDIDGIPAYVVEIKKGPAHQLTLLTVNKQKLYALTASAGEKRWPKRERLLRTVVNSFQPKL